MFWLSVLVTTVCCAPFTGDLYDLAEGDAKLEENVDDVFDATVTGKNIKGRSRQNEVSRIKDILNELLQKWEHTSGRSLRRFAMYEELLKLLDEYEAYSENKQSSMKGKSYSSETETSDYENEEEIQEKSHDEQSFANQNLIYDYIGEYVDYILKDLEYHSLNDGLDVGLPKAHKADSSGADPTTEGLPSGTPDDDRNRRISGDGVYNVFCIALVMRMEVLMCGTVRLCTLVRSLSECDYALSDSMDSYCVSDI